MTNGNFSASGGFWVISAVQEPARATLRIFLTITNTAVVAWPATSTGWTLQTTPTLSNPNWITDPGTPIVGWRKRSN